ncbi:MAG: radical SAM protein [Candidatus Aminicenantes bacterium]|nr:radical SAM protein [Candidatus Aminicenantes bacterium]
MRVTYRTENHPIANVFIAENESGKMLEFVESRQPPYTKKEKWVLIVSTLFGCPVGCKFCDAGGGYQGPVNYDQLMFQIDYLLRLRFQGKYIATEKFKIQFARMGEPAFNPDVLRVLEDLPGKYRFKNFIPSLSTVAPAGSEPFFSRLAEIRRKKYPRKFQLQFSIHSTDSTYRDYLIPVKKWDFQTIAEYGRLFFVKDGMKISLNFALSDSCIVEPDVLCRYFDPEKFLIKVTPVNPTFKASENKIRSSIKRGDDEPSLISALKKAGYDVILSIGEWEENAIGSNCGQYITAVRRMRNIPGGSYTYGLTKVQ